MASRPNLLIFAGVRALDPAQVAKMGSAAKYYVANGARFKKGMKKIG